MNISKNWHHDHTPKTDKARLANSLVLHALRLIEELEPTWWFIENPRDKLRRLPCMAEAQTINQYPATGAVKEVIDTDERTLVSISNGQKVYRKTVSYCRYGDVREKPTDIWTNAWWWEPIPMCKTRGNGTVEIDGVLWRLDNDGKPCHHAAPRGSQTGTQGMDSYKNKSRIPLQIFEDIFEQYSEKVDNI